MLQLFKPRNRSSPVAEKITCQTVRVTYHEDQDNVYSRWREVLLLENGYVRAAWCVDDGWPDSGVGIADYDMNDALLQQNFTLQSWLEMTLKEPHKQYVYSVSVIILGGRHFSFETKQGEGG